MDIYSFYSEMQRQDIILSFKGEITQELLTSVYQIIESRLESDEEDPRTKKKIYHILIECLQNVFHHMQSLRGEEYEKAIEDSRNAIFMIGKNEAGNYRIITGNFIQQEGADELKQRIDSINAMSKEELKALYLEKLSSTELSEKGGAGLGIIDIARKSGNKLDYAFHSVTNETSFFTLAVEIK